MVKKIVFLTFVYSVVSLAGSVYADLNILQGQSQTITGSYSDTHFNIAGTLIVEPGADVTFSGRGAINGDRDYGTEVGAEIIMNGGTFHLLGDSAGDRLTMGEGKDAYLIINDGYFRVGSEESIGDQGDFKLGDESGGAHRIYINAGTLRAHRMEVDGGNGNEGNRNSHIIISAGTLIVENLGEGDPSYWVTAINVDTGLPVLMPGEGYDSLVISDYNDGKIVTAVLGCRAMQPYPEREAENLCPDVVLSWQPGPKTQPTNGHDVYFGTNFDDVNNATGSTTGIYKGRQTAAEYDPSPDLQLGQTYYWRVDQINNLEPASPWKGWVWSFTVNDGTAFDPDPADEATDVPLEPILSWTAGCLATSHDVYFSTSFDAVDNMEPSALQSSGQAQTTWSPGELDFLVEYYWRIVEHSATQTWIGPVWNFRAKSQIVDPNLLLWYNFDETDGNQVADSSGREFHGLVEGDISAVWATIDGHEGGSISMAGAQVVTMPAGALNLWDDHEVTISVWVKQAMRSGTPNWVFSMGGEISSWPVQWNLGAAIPASDGTSVLYTAGEGPPETEEPTEFDSNDVMVWTKQEGASVSGWVSDWHHFVFTKNENEDTMSIYLDGILADQRTDATTDSLSTLRAKADADDLHIGAYFGSDDGYSGKIDDFRIYDYAMSDQEVELLFRGGSLELAWAPKPANGSADVGRPVVLTWKPGNFADQHDVYFGTSFEDVNDADTTTPVVYVGRQDANSYDPPGYLELNTDYYWRIDEVNDANIWKGNTWKFTMANFLVLDDFESYDYDLDDLYWFYGGNWLDGIDNSTGATLYLGVSGEPIHDGVQSLMYIYQNSFSYYSEAERVINPGERDWTAEGVKMLTLFFCGDPGNDIGSTEQMYAGIKDGGGTSAKVAYGVHTGEGMSDIQVADWHEWNIPLAEFNDVTLTNVTNLYIMFGESDNTTPAGSGTVYFDDIRLYLPKCVPAYGPEYDFSGNCIVDYADIALMAEDWLRSDWVLSTETPTAGPVGWWKLDEDSGTAAADSSGNGSTGTVEGDFAWVTGHIGTHALDLQGNGSRVLVPHKAILNPTSRVTAMAWVNYSDASHNSARVIAKGANTGDNDAYVIEIGDDDNARFFIRSEPTHENESVDAPENSMPQDVWIHVAGSYDGDAVNIYVNGRLVGSETVGAKTIIVDTNGLAIGNAVDVDRALIGKVDDVRVYSVALPEAQIAHIATEGTGYVPLVSVYNLHDLEAQGLKAVNFRDFAKFMTAWLEEKLWPAE